MVKLIATSVVRGSHQGESHGGVFLIDFDNEVIQQPVDWNKSDIDWQGRGWDRGLRGIAFCDNQIFIAASDELFVYDPDFTLIESHRNPYLKHCHEIVRHEEHVFLTSTGFDTLLGFNLTSRRFDMGIHISSDGVAIRPLPFDPQTDDGPLPLNKLHINSIHCEKGGLYFAGMNTPGLMIFNGRKVGLVATLPPGTHNARPYDSGVLFNDTRANVVRHVRRDGEQAFHVPTYEPAKLLNTHLDQSGIARQGFGRGLCLLDDGVLAAGSSPSTVAVHNLVSNKTEKVVTLSLDIRNAIHGLEVWPYG